jgi:acetyltransferase-like isoleucine patch superfamily enzyme
MRKVIRPFYHAWIAFWWWIVKTLPFLRPLYETRLTQTPIRLSGWFIQKVMGINRRAYWPVHFSSQIIAPNNVYAGVETCPGYMPGCYIQGLGEIYIGDYTQIAANVGIISANHDVYNNRAHIEAQPVRIGRYGWIGMNAVILPGVQLGDFTIVGAGSVVTKSFPEGYCIIAGNPAKMIRQLDKNQCFEHKSQYEYHGYIRKDRFEAFRRKRLNV